MSISKRKECSWERILTDCKAVWRRSSDALSSHPHVKLAGGYCSDSFVYAAKVFEDPRRVAEVSEGLVKKYEESYGHPEHIERVVGPAMGAIPLAMGIATVLNERYHRDSGGCRWGYAEREEKGNRNTPFVFRQYPLLPREKVLVVEDVCTSGGSVTSTLTAVAKAEGHTAPAILSFVQRRSVNQIHRLPLISLVHYDMEVWPHEECPFCAMQSPSISVNSYHDFLRLTGKAMW